MSLLGTIQIANNTLLASQIGLQVAGNNIANASTPDYIRQEAVLTPAATQTIGQLTVGLGVRVDGIVQKIDRYLAERLRGAVSDVQYSETQENFYLQLEAMMGELGDTDLSSSLGRFFSAIHDVLNEPEDLALRHLAVLQGETLLADIQRLDQRVRDVRQNINDEVVETSGRLNRLLAEIAELNVKIVSAEGATPRSDAVGLRDRRYAALTELAEIIAVRAVEQPSGSVTVFAGGEFLVFEDQWREIVPSYTTDRGLITATLHLKHSDAPINTSSGRLPGLYSARDEILGGFLDELESFTSTLTFEFNKIFSSGQGLSGFQELTSWNSPVDAQTPLDRAGLPYVPLNGSFQIRIANLLSGQLETSDVFVDLNGLDDDTSLADLTAALDAIDGLAAAITSTGQLQLRSESSDFEFSFASDSSGVLAALGLNVLFVGSTPLDSEIHPLVKADPGKFAASRGGVGEDADNAALLAGFANQPLSSLEENSISNLYESIVGRLSQASSATQAVTDGVRVFQQTLEGQKLSQSGVSIDDEALKIISFQRMYQASARLIATIDSLLETLMNL
jgi:flagellar hook-associated protein 1 FlgK